MMLINIDNPWILLILYLIVINIISIIMFGIDKRRANLNAWRIPNAVLLGLCAIGGSVGGLFGMYLFRHKTKTWYYVVGIPIIISLQLLLIIFILYRQNMLV